MPAHESRFDQSQLSGIYCIQVSCLRFFWEFFFNLFCFRFPNLRLLDFRKIKTAHRKDAVELFKSKRGKDLLKEIAKKTKSNMPAFAAAENNNSKGWFCVDLSFSRNFILFSAVSSGSIAS